MPRVLALFVVCLTVAPLPAGPLPGFRFEDVSAQAGLTKLTVGWYNHAIAWGDFDNDGLLDLFVGSFADKGFDKKLGQTRPVPNQLFRQVARGKFVRFPCAPVEIAARCSGAVFVDLDNDGDLDLYVTSNKLDKAPPRDPADSPRVQGCRLYRNDGGGTFVDISAACGACPPTLLRGRDIGVFDHDNDGLLDLLVIQDRAVAQDGKVLGSRLYRNLGKLKFADVTAQVGLPLDLWGAGLVIGDVNDDGRADIFVSYSNRLFLSQPGHAYKEAVALKEVFDHHGESTEDIVVGAAFGDIDNDGDLDLISGTHHTRGLSRVHVFLNGGVKDGVPQFREVTRELGIPVIPQRAPSPDIQDFDNDGLPDLYWSAFFAEGDQRQPFICRGLGVRDGLPRFAMPSVAEVKPEFAKDKILINAPPAQGMGMVYYVDGPAVDYDGDGRIELFAGSWPPEGSRLFRNVGAAGNWLQVRVEGKRMNRMGVGAQVRTYPAGKGGDRAALLGFQQVTVNAGYSSARTAPLHFGLGKLETCDVEVRFPSGRAPALLRNVKVNQRLVVSE